MADGRDIVAVMAENLEKNSGTLVENVAGSQETVTEILNGFGSIQKKFFMKTSGGTERAVKVQQMLDEVIQELNTGGQALTTKFEAFSMEAKDTIHIALTTIIRMT